MNTVRLKDIAEACGVSIATVSRSLSREEADSNSMAALIRRTAREMGYVPNAAAVTLKTCKSNNIGILYEDQMDHEYFSSLLNDLRAEAGKRGYDITLIGSRGGLEQSNYYEHARRRNLDGVVVIQADFDSAEVIRLASSPMPTVIISTLCEDGKTNLGPYSLVQPYYVAGKDYYAMLLCCRNSSNTAQNILRNGKCTLNFIDDKPESFKEAVKLSWPGDKPEEKMPKCKFKLEKSLIEEETGEARPMVLTDAIEAIECTWMRELDGAEKDLAGELNGYEGPYHDFNGITSKFGAHFILRVDKILMKKKYSDAIINGVRAKDFPPLPVDYGYRDSKNFWFHRKTKMRAELLQMRKASLESVRYAADRADDTVKFTDEALMTVLGVPRVFLSVVLKGCVAWAKENDVTLITAEHMQIINDKRSKEKNKK